MGVFVFLFLLITFIVTFLGGDLPWTAHRSSAIQLPEGVEAHEYDGYENYKVCFDKHNYEEQYYEQVDALFDLAERFDVSIYSIGLWDRKWLEVTIEEDDYIMLRGILNFYAKWNDIPIFYQFGGPIELQ